ncbi:hypothetical protein [Microvirga thermotolerans]|uniref:Uncharacterized protein n=1 Tax=Microvirga thermotolerans TaxID=2651334 RepID=A0A5P9JXR3_9HYPH|nr:hypothetical protein [Microvirga thermotolerans]QFU17223.1 hypothetical protein GDR74_13885 [Microvirga thermotolerans]
MTIDEKAGEFTRLHSLFTFHLGVAVALSWLTSIYASFYAPWVRNIRPLIDPSYAGQVESTWSFLFVFPAVLTVAWIMSVSGREMFRHMRIFKNQVIEFAIAGALAFAVFYLAIDRAVTALSLGL